MDDATFASLESSITSVMQVPDDRIGGIIGSGGTGLRRLFVETGVQITVPRTPAVNGERTMEMTGNADQIRAAQQLVQHMIENPTQAGAKRKLPEQFNHQRVQQQMAGIYSAPPMQQMGMPGPIHPLQWTQPTHPGMAAGLGQGAPMQFGGESEAKFVIEASRVGPLIGKSGAGLKAIREASGAGFSVGREEFLGGRLLTIKPPVVAQQRCIALICDRLATTGMSDVNDAEQVISIKMLFPSAAAGAVIGKAGAGLKTLRELGVKIDLPRDELPNTDRVLTISGPPLSVCAAIGAILAKLGA